MSDYIVRADFYPNGDIIPLGITNLKGETQFIEKIITIEKSIVDKKTKYVCESRNNIMLLILKDGRWYREQ